MKRLICFVFLCGFTLPQVSAQVHLKGQQFVDLQAGLSDGLQLNKNQGGVSALISTGRYNRQYNAWKVTVSVLQKQLTLPHSGEANPTRQFAIGWGYEFNLFRNATRTRFVRGVVQPTLLYEYVSVEKTIGSATTRAVERDSRFLLGVDLGLEVELSPVVICVRQRWQPNSVVQPFHTLFLVGWRFHR